MSPLHRQYHRPHRAQPLPLSGLILTSRSAQTGAVQAGMIALVVVVLLISAGAYWQTQQSAQKRHAAEHAASTPHTNTAQVPQATTPAEPALTEPALTLYPARLSLVTDSEGALVGCSGVVGDQVLQQQLMQRISSIFIEQYQPCDIRYDSAYQAELMDINAAIRLAQIVSNRPDVMIAINHTEMIAAEQTLGSKGAVVISAPSAEELDKIEAAVREQTGHAFSLHALQPVDVASSVLHSVQTANQMLKMLPDAPRPADITALLNQQMIRFGFDESEIPPLNQPLLEQVAPYLKQYPELQLQIRAFTAAVGSSQYSLELSTRRAEAIRQAWIAQGVDAKQLLAVGLGQQQPIAENVTEQGRFWNERVEFQWVSPAVNTVADPSPAGSRPTDSDVPKS